MFVCAECGATSQVQGTCVADGTELAPIGEDLLLGTTIGAYRVARLLGIGGMGRVYKGVHPTIGSRVAIKVLSRECSDRRDLVERFFAEARAVNLIRHESIVNVLDLATLPDGRPYIIMEFLDGAPLSTLVEIARSRGSRLPLGGLARLCSEVLDALDAAHGKGVIHRDLKPDNVFVTPSGRPKVLDFGIAKLVDTPIDAATRTGSLLGTPHYMSPEQASGRAVDIRTDLYAMGVILYECATGEKPFVADSLFELLRKHVEDPPLPPSQLRPDIPPALEQVILMALAKSPDQRYATARAMNVALQQATANLPADSWVPITGGLDLSATLARGFGPPTPQSWGSGAGQPTTPNTPSDLPTRPKASTTEASAGQVLRRQTRKRSSRAGLWIALGAIALVGSGIAFAVTRGGDGATHGAASTVASTAPVTTTPASAVGTASAAGTASAGTGTDTAPSTAGTGTDTARSTAGTGADTAPSTAGTGTDTAPSTAGTAASTARTAPTGTSTAGTAPTGTGTGTGSTGTGKNTSTATIAGAEADGDQPATRKNVDQAMAFPHATKVDVSRFVGAAIKEVKALFPDAQLVRIGAPNVASDGTVNLALPNGDFDTDITVRFMSKSLDAKDPSLPKGVKQASKGCQIYAVINKDETRIYTPSGICMGKPIPYPRCTAKQVWAKALASRPNLAGSVAELDYREWGGAVVWGFDAIDPKVELRLPDDC